MVRTTLLEPWHKLLDCRRQDQEHAPQEQQQPQQRKHLHVETEWAPVIAIPAGCEAEGDCQLHGVRTTPMDRRVHGGRLLRSQASEPQTASVLSLLDVAFAPGTPRSDRSTPVGDARAAAHHHAPRPSSPSGAGDFPCAPWAGHAAGSASCRLLSRLSSLDTATLHQLDRALSCGLDCGPALSCSGPWVPPHPQQQPISASLPAGKLGRIYKVRPLGAAPSSSLSLHSIGGGAGGGGGGESSPFSRTSTLLDMAEEQASLAASSYQSYHYLGGGSGGGGGGCGSLLRAAAAGHTTTTASISGSGRFDYSMLLSANNSTSGAAAGGVGGGGGGFCRVGGRFGVSPASSAAASLSASPNPQQPQISLTALVDASMSNGGGGGGSVYGGNRSAAGASGAAATACKGPFAAPAAAATAAAVMASASGPPSYFCTQSLAGDTTAQRGAPTLGAPDMRLFPFSSPEDFYMAATVLLDANLPCVPSEDAPSASPDA